MKQIFLLAGEVNWSSLHEMDLEYIQKSDVVAACDGYFDGSFLESGIVPQIYLYTREVPKVLSGSDVQCVKYDGTLAGAIQALVDLHELKGHIRVLGSHSIKALANDPEFPTMLSEWNKKFFGVSLVFDGSKHMDTPLIPIWNARMDDENLTQVKPNLSKQAMNFGAQLFKESLSFLSGNSDVSEEEYTRKWNTCLGCPKLVEKNPEDFRCAECGCPMQKKARWRTGKCADDENPKF